MKNIDSYILRVHHSWRFIGRLLARAKFYVDSEKAPTACTDGKGSIWINPEFADTLSDSDMILIIAHEVLHIIMRNVYGPLSTPEYPEIWNIAEDIVVNSILDEHYVSGQSVAMFDKTKVTIDKVGIWPKNNSVSVCGVTINNIPEKTVRDIYWELVNQLPRISRNGSGKNGGKGGESDGSDGKWYKSVDDHSKLNSESGEQSQDASDAPTKETWQRAVMQAAMAEQKSKGTLPGCLNNIIEEIADPKIPWRDRLKNAMLSTMITDTSFSKFNKRSCVLGSPMPGYVREGLDVILHLDTSGSTYSDLPGFLSEIKGIAELVPSSKVTVIQCDADIQSIDDISADFSEFSAKGFGGTSHVPVVDYVNDMQQPPKVFISFTDGYSDIEECYPKLRDGVYKIICLPEQSKHLTDNLSQYGEVLVID